MKTFKNVKQTDKNHAHINVFENGVYIGYITSPEVNTVSGKWRFSGTPENYSANTKSELLKLIGKN